MTYRDGNAVKILAAERMGIRVSHSDVAQTALRGEPTASSAGQQIEIEACRLHNFIRGDGARMHAANKHAADILIEYGFDVPGIAPAAKTSRPAVN
ncbi:hypothetical protein [Roseateles asaccharophilus]|uniref:hypothetical protein n=1 Tax=Roseateles asaccharophilus TaxID=582607 RepID=UPI00384CBF6A